MKIKRVWKKKKRWKKADENSGTTVVLTILAIIALILFFSYIGGLYCPNEKNIVKRLKCAIVGIAGSITNGVNSLFTGVENMTQQQIDYATGGVYAGSADKNSNKVGVEIKNLETLSPTYFEGDTISYNAEIVAYSIIQGETKTPYSMTLQVDCFYYPLRNKSDVKEFGTTTTTMYTGAKNVDCTINDKLKPGSYVIGVKTRFNAVSFGRRLVCFVDRSTLNSLFASNRIKDKKDAVSMYGYGNFLGGELDKTKYSDGMVEIGIKMDDSPIPIKAGDSLLMGITIKNKHPSTGRIVRVNNLELAVPQGMQLVQRNSGYYTVTPGPSIKRSNVYYITIPGSIKKYATANLKFSVSNPTTLLTYPDGSVKDFKCVYVSLKVDYIYELVKKKTITVHKGSADIIR